MKIFVVGATGRVGRKLVNKLAEKGHTVYAEARSAHTLEKAANIMPIALDLHANTEEIAAKMHDAEVVYFVAGSRGKDLLQTDLNGAVKVMQAAEAKGIQRFIHLSSIFALDTARWDERFFQQIPDYYVAKFFSDSWLVNNASLDYTIVQPGSLLEEPGTGKIAVNVTEPAGNTIDDVATTLAKVLDHPNTIQKVILMHEGDTPIDEALKRV